MGKGGTAFSKETEVLYLNGRLGLGYIASNITADVFTKAMGCKT